MTLQGKIQLGLQLQQGQAFDLANGVIPIDRWYTTALANGVAAGQADKIFHDRRTISASGNDDLDLAGVLTDAFGAPLSFVKVKALVVSAAAANANNVVVGGAASNGFISWVGGATHTVTVRPGATMSLFVGQADAAGYAVTAATADILRITNGGAGSTVDYDIWIVGTSA